ncbi:hypothetical protein ABNQ39_36805 (plasmid) [Azospirillum sp. A26]|uniref:hypothetical protein n=1 Tax=Azospirillum sp. A26 TaxID=3160607 RepID=UPI0036732216
MRSDAYAAVTLRQSCFFSPQEIRDLVGQACLGLALQPLQLWSYALFDKSGAGLRRQYLENGDTHPNFLMRLLAMNIVMTDGDESGIKLLKDFLDNREKIAKQLSSPVP